MSDYKDYPSVKARRPIFVRARELLQNATKPLSKYEVAELIHCDPKNAWRVLVKMHREEGVLRISRWERDNGAPLPFYSWGAGRDAIQPIPMTIAERRAKRRRDPRVREVEAAKKRAARSVGKDVRLGIWGI